MGRTLCRATFAAARRRGYRTLRATIRADNAVALAFYTSQGFAVVGTRRGAARERNATCDAVLAERHLVGDR